MEGRLTLKHDPLKGYQLIGGVYSNFDHELNDKVASSINENTLAIHSAWDFQGSITFDKGKYKEFIYQFHELVDTIEDENLMECIKKANDKFGEA